MFFGVVVYNDTATHEIYTYIHTLSLHDALPIYCEQILVALLEQRPGRAVAFDHGHFVFFSDRRDGLGKGGPVWPQDVLDAVLLDQAFGKLRAARQIGRAHV